MRVAVERVSTGMHIAVERVSTGVLIAVERVSTEWKGFPLECKQKLCIINSSLKNIVPLAVPWLLLSVCWFVFSGVIFLLKDYSHNIN